MARRQIMFTSRHHSNTGIMSAILGVISFASLIYGIVSSYLLSGNIPFRFGAGCALSTLYALTGWLLGVFAIRDSESYRLSSALGIVLNTISLLISAFLLWIPE